MDGTEFCPRCGGVVATGDAFCRKCGTDLRPSSEATAQAPAPQAAASPPAGTSVADTLAWCLRRPGESAAEHLARIADLPGQDPDAEELPDDIRSGWLRLAVPSMAEVIRQVDPVVPPESDAVTCDACYAVTHPLLAHCVGCGRPIGPRAFGRGRVSTREQVVYEMVAGDIRSWRVLARAGTSIADDLGKDPAARLSSDILRLGADPARWEEYQGDIARTSRERRAARERDSWRAGLFGTMEFRYLGGLPGYPGTFDVAVLAHPDALRVSARGATIAEIPYHAILGAWPFPEDISLSSTRLGFFSGPLLYLPDPKYRGGGLSVAAVIGDRPSVFAIGNREGWFTRKASFEFYACLPGELSLHIEPAAEERANEIGVEGLAEELGLAGPG